MFQIVGDITNIQRGSRAAAPQGRGTRTAATRMFHAASRLTRPATLANAPSNRVRSVGDLDVHWREVGGCES